jgi:hypothetical protein
MKSNLEILLDNITLFMNKIKQNAELIKILLVVPQLRVYNERNSRGSGLESLEYGLRDPSR